MFVERMSNKDYKDLIAFLCYDLFKTRVFDNDGTSDEEIFNEVNENEEIFVINNISLLDDYLYVSGNRYAKLGFSDKEKNFQRGIFVFRDFYAIAYPDGREHMGIVDVLANYLNSSYLKFMYKKFGTEYKDEYKKQREKSWKDKTDEYNMETNEIIEEMTR
ncbi:MAG: hypothetical protein IJ371_04980 [Clostridia bacterium]|nr:hypothetical protein [Clostridia bacterium]